MEVNHDQLKKLVTCFYKSKTPLDIKGATGIGKSEVVKQVAKKIAKLKNKKFVEWNRISIKEKEKYIDYNMNSIFIFADLRISQMDPTDLKGFPKVNEKYSKWVPNLLFKVISNPNVEGIVFFDEMNLAAPAVMNASLQVINDCAIGETPLSKEILYISAGNRIDDGCQVYEESTALNTRRANVVLMTPSIKKWTEWAIINNVDSRVISFLQFKEESLYQYDNNINEKSFPTPRMWVKISNTIKNENDNKLIRLVVSSCVGESTGREFIRFLELGCNIDIIDLLNNPIKIKQYSIDLKYSIIGSIICKVSEDNNLLDKVVDLCSYLETDMGMYMLHIIKNNINEFHKKIMNCSNWIKVSNKYANITL